jgi:hypothetical protein
MLSLNKYRVLFFAICMCSLTMQGQRFLGTSVISSFGLEAHSANYDVDHTIGEVMTSTFVGSTFTITQGFHQSSVINTQVDELQQNSMVIYPNPARETLNFNLSELGNGIVRLDLYDITGKMVLNKVIDRRFEDKLDISRLKSGIYLLRGSSVSGEVLFTHKFEKID